MSRVAAFNYNYCNFTSADSLTANYAEITYQDIKYILYPDKGGQFTFDTYEFSRELFNYIDLFNYDGNMVDANQSKVIDFNITITNFDGTTESMVKTVTFFNGAFQRWECPFVEDEIVNLSEIKMPYWDGYPFDYSQVIGDEVTRVLVDDGTGGGADPNVRDCPADCDGIYLKWHNGRWGYSYYLFEPIAKENFRTKSLGDVREHCSWTDNYLDIGKNGQREMNLFSYVDYNDRELMKSLADSNEVYLYTGERFDKANTINWLEVKIDKMVVSETNKNNRFEQLVTIQLPKEQTRTRI